MSVLLMNYLGSQLGGFPISSGSCHTKTWAKYAPKLINCFGSALRKLPTSQSLIAGFPHTLLAIRCSTMWQPCFGRYWLVWCPSTLEAHCMQSLCMHPISVCMHTHTASLWMGEPCWTMVIHLMVGITVHHNYFLSREREYPHRC